MPDVIRLVCPECDAVHRVKNITLGKLYRCKKCKSGLITMSPAILACPSCNATKPPAHIEVSQLITCDECADAPLMNVRFTAPQRNHRHLVEVINGNQQSDVTSDSTDDRLPPSQPAPLPSPRSEEKAQSTQDPAATATAILPPAQAEQPVLASQETEVLAAPAQEDEPAPLFANQQTAPQEEPASSTQQAVQEETPEPTAESAQEEEVETTTNQPYTATETDITTTAESDLPPQERASATAVEEPAMKGPDTTIREGLGAQPNYSGNLAQAPLYVAPEPYREAPLRDDLDFPPDDLHLSPNNPAASNIDEATLKRLLVQMQEPLIRQLEVRPTGAPLWIPIALAILLFALYGWLIGEMDGLRQDLIITRDQLQQADKDLKTLRGNYLEERKSFHAIISESRIEKKRLDKDLEELMLRNQQLRQQMLNLPGPELGTNE